MTITKKIRFIVVSALCFILSMAFCFGAEAANRYEQESNDSYGSADRFYSGDRLYGAVSSYDDKDYFKFIAPSNGVLNLTFNHRYVSNYSSWNIEVYIYASGAYSKLSSTDISLEDNEKIVLPCVGVRKNASYYVCVSRAYGDVEGITYSVSTSFTSSAYYEKELNDDYYTATTVSLNKTYNGTISHYDDKDYYKFVAPANGVLKVRFDHLYENSSAEWKVELYMYHNGAYTLISSDNIGLSDTEKYYTPALGLQKGYTYYVVVSRWDSGVIGKKYKLLFNYQKTDNWEKEENDTFSTATMINKYDTTFSGTLNSNDDADYFKIVPSRSGKMNISFIHNVKQSYGGWRVYIYTYKNGSYNEISNTYIGKSDKNKVVLLTVSASKRNTYYVVVERDSDVVGEIYGMSVNLPGSTSSKVTGFVNKSGTLKYYKNGRLASSYTGIVLGTINGKRSWYYVKNGNYTKATGIAKKADGSSSKWYFVKNGIYTKATGIAKRADGKSGKWYLVKNGSYAKATGIARKADGSSKTRYFVLDGVWNKYTGWIFIGDKKYKIVKGVVK